MDRSVRLLTLGVAIRMLGVSLYNPFLALFLYNVLGLGYVEISLLIVAVGAIQIPFGVVGGLLADRLGHRRLILLGMAAEAIATLGLGYAFMLRSLPGAVGAALAGGIVTTAAGPAFSAYIADRTQGSERTRGFTWFRIGFNAGFSAGVAIGGVLVASVGFSGAVYVAAAIVGASTVLLAAYLPPSLSDRAQAALPGTASPGRPGPEPPRRTMAESLGLLRHDRVALEVALAVALVAVVAAQWAVTFPLFVHNGLGIGYSALGIGLALNGLLVVFAQSWTTRSVLGRRHTTIGIVGTLLYAVAFVGLGAAGFFGIAPLVVFFVAVVVLTEGENLISIPSATLPSNLSPPGETGAYNGLFQAIQGAAFLGAILLGGIALTDVGNPLLLWVLLTAPVLPAVLLLRHASGRIPVSANTA